MDLVINFIHSHLEIAHFVIFFLLILAGFNFPISEDLLVITTGILASSLIPEHTYKLFFWLFLGCYLSDWIPYALGRFFGPKILKLKWFSRSLKKNRMDKITYFYQRYGIWTLTIGRFIPFGVRNILFFSAGMIKMSFLNFILSDGIVCIISNVTLFYLAYSFGRNYDTLMRCFWIFKVSILVLAIILIISLILLFLFKKTNKKKRMKDSI